MSTIYELDLPCGCKTDKFDPRIWHLCGQHPSAQMAVLEWAAKSGELEAENGRLRALVTDRDNGWRQANALSAALSNLIEALRATPEEDFPGGKWATIQHLEVLLDEAVGGRWGVHP